MGGQGDTEMGDRGESGMDMAGHCEIWVGRGILKRGADMGGQGDTEMGDWSWVGKDDTEEGRQGDTEMGGAGVQSGIDMAGQRERWVGRWMVKREADGRQGGDWWWWGGGSIRYGHSRSL